jgi:hypothetical protein
MKVRVNFPKTEYKIRTKEECEQKGKSLIEIIKKKWKLWANKEENHDNKDEPVSPVFTGLREKGDAVLCPTRK